MSSAQCLAPLRGVGQGRGRREFKPNKKDLGCERCLIFVAHFSAFLTGNTLNFVTGKMVNGLEAQLEGTSRAKRSI